MEKKGETRKLKTYTDILLQSAMLDFKMTNLESNITSKIKEIEALDRMLKEDHKDIERLQQQIAAVEEKEAMVKRNIEAHRLTKSTMEGLKLSLTQELKSITERNVKMKETHDAILEYYEKKWEQYEITYNKLPWTKERNALRNEVKRNTILLNIAIKKLHDEIEKAKLYKKITDQRYKIAIVKFAGAMVSREEQLKKIKAQENSNKKLEEEIEQLRLKFNELSQQQASRTKNAVANAKERAGKLQAIMGLFASSTGYRPTELTFSNYSTPSAKFPIPQRTALSTPSGAGRCSAIGTGSPRESENPLLRYSSFLGISKPPESLMKLLTRQNSTSGSGFSSPLKVLARPDAGDKMPSRCPAEETAEKVPEPPASAASAGETGAKVDASKMPVAAEKPDEGSIQTGAVIQTEPQLNQLQQAVTEIQAEPQPEQPQQKKENKEKPQELPAVQGSPVLKKPPLLQKTPSNQPTVHVPREKLGVNSGGKCSTPRPVLQRRNISLANAQRTRFFRPSIDLSEPEPKRPKRTPPPPPPPVFKEPPKSSSPKAEPAKHVTFADQDKEKAPTADKVQAPRAQEKSKPEPEKIEDDTPVSEKNIQEMNKDVFKEPEGLSIDPLSSQSTNNTSLMMSPINDSGRQIVLDDIMSPYNLPEHLKNDNLKTPTGDYFSNRILDITPTVTQEDKTNKITTSPVQKGTSEFPKDNIPVMSPVLGGLSLFQGPSAGPSNFGSLFFGSSKESDKKSKPSSSSDFFSFNF